MTQFGGFVGRDLAEVLAGVRGLRQGDHQRVAVLGLLELDPGVVLVDDLLPDGHDRVALLPQENEPLCNKKVQEREGREISL